MSDTIGGRLEGIWIKRAHRGLMDPVQEAQLDPERGLIGSVDRSRRRQVTLLEAECWARLMRELQTEIDPCARRANLLVSGVSLYETRGRILQIGSVQLVIGGKRRHVSGWTRRCRVYGHVWETRGRAALSLRYVPAVPFASATRSSGCRQDRLGVR